MNEIKLSPQLKPGKPPKQPPVGLGGWFALIMIGLILSIIADIGGTVKLFQSDLSYMNLFFLLFFIICITNELILSAVILFFIFKRNILFRLLFVIQTCVFAVCYFAYLFLCAFYNIPPDISFMTIFARILWTVYLFRSERVKNTFIGTKSIAQIVRETETPAS